MANEEQIYTEERADGKFAIRRGNSERASAVEETQEKAEEVVLGPFCECDLVDQHRARRMRERCISDSDADLGLASEAKKKVISYKTDLCFQSELLRKEQK